MHYKSLLVITYGRSGSTLLQGILNSIEGCLIRGENNNFCFHLLKTYQAILAGKEKEADLITDYPSTVVNHPWYGIRLLDESLFVQRCAQMVKELLLADKNDSQTVQCYGFKDRYTYPYILDEFKTYLNFLTQIFTDVGFIFNTRNLDDVLKSGWWQDYDPVKSMELLRRTEALFYDYQMKYPDNTFHIRYEDIVNKTLRLQEMFDFIGTKYNSSKIDEVLAQKHSYNQKQEKVRHLGNIQPSFEPKKGL